MDSFEVISPLQPPSQAEWKLPLLYRVDAKGKDSQWEIGFDGVDQIMMTYGKVGGKLRTTSTQITPKRKRTMQEQAFQEAKHRYQNKIEKDGYMTGTGKGQEENHSNVIVIPQPMLANRWLSDKTTINYPVGTQPKLDGIRCLAYDDGNEIQLRSRNGKLYSFLDHIRQEVSTFLTYLPSGVIFDGEFYSQDLTFQEMTSIIRRTKTKHPDESKIEYWIFDLIHPDNPPFNDRFDLLIHAYLAYVQDGHAILTEEGKIEGTLRIVDIIVAESKEEILELFSNYIEEGYEGIMIRQLDAPYKFGRSKFLLKYKDVFDEEGIVVDVSEGKGSEKGTAILIIEDKRGNRVPVRFRGSFEERKRWLQRPEMVLGKQATVEYQELTTDGKWRFPVGVDLRDYE